MTTSEKIVNDKSTVISPSNEWILANVTLSAKLSAVHSNGEFFTIENEKSIDLLEYAKTMSHTHNSGGGMSMRQKQVADAFLIDTNVEAVYVYRNGEDDKFIISIYEDTDDISLKLAKIKKALLKQSTEYYFEVTYELSDSFELSGLPLGTRRFTRG